MLTKKHLVGIVTSALLFGMFGMFIGFFAIAIGGVSYSDPFSALATGPTRIPLTDVFDPFGLTPEVIGLQADDTIVLPAIPATIALAGHVIDLVDFTVAEVFGYGGAGFGALVGYYYAIRISYEQRQDTSESDETIAPDE